MDGPYQSMLASLRKTFGERLPAGLTEIADGRLQRTLKHYIGQVLRVHGTMNEQEILRETFDSMASWFRRNTEQLSPVFQRPSPPLIEHAVAPDTGSAYDMVGGSGEAPMDGEQDPLVLFAKIRAARESGDPFPSATATVPGRLPEPVETRKPVAAPTVPELKPLETRIKPRLPADTFAVQPKDFLQPQEDVVKYREAEYNLILNSKDRNWLKNTKENRYNFSVMLDSASRAQGTGMQPTIQNRLRNIVRIEFVKALLPVEGLNLIIPRCYNGNSNCIDAPWNGFVSVLGMPSVTVVMDEEKDANTIGTNDTVNKSLAVCQYDATWRSDQFQTNKDLNRGYTLFFPKFMKAQRVYAPTPLANLQRMSFQLLNPENQLLSKAPDSVAVEQIVRGNLVTSTQVSCYKDENYLYIRTTEYFPMWSFAQTDRIKLGGLVYVGVQQSGGNALIEWLQREEGHVVVAIANGTIDTLTEGANACGLANYIIIQNKLKIDGQAGTCDLDYFTGTEPADSALFAAFRNYPVGYEGAGALNLSRQVQLVLRVITREYDPTTNVRPDNI